MNGNSRRVLHVAAELYPLVKTGGLGDVAAALPAALRKMGVDARLLLPRYPALRDGILDQQFVQHLVPAIGAAAPSLWLGRVAGSGVPVYLLDAPELYDRPGNPYLGPDGRDWPDNARRFALLGWVAARAAIEGFGEPGGRWRAEIVHGHDWHAGLAPAYLAAAALVFPGRRTPSVFTIHNLAFQGLFATPAFSDLGLPPDFFAVEGVEFYGRISFMKAALHFADRITTVSPTYAREIQTPEHGAGLDGLLRARARDVGGILNGVDYAVWNSADDPALPAAFTAEDLTGKARAKAALQAAIGLAPDPRAPLFGAVTRLTQQKGFDLVLAAMPDLVADGAQLALLGSGDADLEQGFRGLAGRFPGRIGVRIGYDESLAHRIIGGADAVLVPSRFEPCGLTQLYALRYGTLPVVRRTGGLADTVVDVEEARLQGGTATGFVFDPAEPGALREAMRRAVSTYRRTDVWQAVQRQAMACRFGWDEAATRYAAVYDSMMPSGQPDGSRTVATPVL